MLSSPATMRNVVVLPQPEGPTSTTNSLSSNVEVDILDRVHLVVFLVEAAHHDLSHRAYPLTEPVMPET